MLVDDSVVYEWPVGPGLRVIVRWRENDEVTARIEVVEDISNVDLDGPAWRTR